MAFSSHAVQTRRVCRAESLISRSALVNSGSATRMQAALDGRADGSRFSVQRHVANAAECGRVVKEGGLCNAGFPMALAEVRCASRALRWERCNAFRSELRD